MLRSDIRDEAANKLQLTMSILEMIKEGRSVNPAMVDKAIKDIDELMAGLDRKSGVKKKVVSDFILWIKKVCLALVGKK